MKECEVDEDEEVDIVNFDKDPAFSDSDAPADELCFLTAVPSPDAPEQQDKYVGSSTKVEESTLSGSPLSVDAEQNDQTITLPSLSPTEGNIIHTLQMP